VVYGYASFIPIWFPLLYARLRIRIQHIRIIFFRIRDGKKSDPWSGIIIPDPRHWFFLIAVPGFRDLGLDDLKLDKIYRDPDPQPWLYGLEFTFFPVLTNASERGPDQLPFVSEGVGLLGILHSRFWNKLVQQKKWRGKTETINAKYLFGP